MPTRNVVLTDHHQDLIESLVKSGRYQNASEVLRDGLRLVEERDAREAARLEALREAARVGFSDIDEGLFQDIGEGELDEVIAALGHEAEERAGRGSQPVPQFPW
jgi:antitoxin ParD1/3/4